MAGFEDSSIKMWKLQPAFSSEIPSTGGSSGEKTPTDDKVNVNHVHLMGDLPEDVAEKNRSVSPL